MTWVDERSGFDIYMERLNSTGTPQWGTGSGVPLATTTDFGDPAPIIADGAGGAIITWEFDQANFDIAAQRVNAAGVPQWGGGVAVCTAANTQWFPRIVSDGGAGAIITWPDDRSGLGWSIFAQHLNASGVSQWTPNGKALSALISDPVHAVVPAIAANGAGGAIVAWPDNRAGLGNHDIYERNVTASGILSLPADGTPLCTAAGEQVGPSIESDGVNAIVTWQDQRSGNWDIYASPIGVLTGVGDTPSVSALSLTPNYPNPFLSRTSMSLDLPAAGDVKIEVFDVAGHRVRHADLGRMSAGSREMRFDGHDDAGRLLPSGVYFYRVHAGAETVTEKMVIAR
jgi:hypothetical protein